MNILVFSCIKIYKPEVKPIITECLFKFILFKTQYAVALIPYFVQSDYSCRLVNITHIRATNRLRHIFVVKLNITGSESLS